MEYLTDRVYGRPTQTVQGNPEQPVTIQLQWSSTPEWLTKADHETLADHLIHASNLDVEDSTFHTRWSAIQPARSAKRGIRFPSSKSVAPGLLQYVARL